MYRRAPERMAIAHFNDKLTACVNTGIPAPFGSSFEDQPTDRSRYAPRPWVWIPTLKRVARAFAISRRSKCQARVQCGRDYHSAVRL